MHFLHTSPLSRGPILAKPKIKQGLSQKERFLAYAKEQGIEDDTEFERALNKVLRHPVDSHKDSGN
jgi:hypothetical protein